MSYVLNKNSEKILRNSKTKHYKRNQKAIKSMQFHRNFNFYFLQKNSKCSKFKLNIDRNDHNLQFKVNKNH